MSIELFKKKFTNVFRNKTKISQCTDYLGIWSAMKIRKLKLRYYKTTKLLKNVHFLPKKPSATIYSPLLNSVNTVEAHIFVWSNFHCFKVKNFGI